MGGVTDRHSAIFVLCPLRVDAVEKGLVIFGEQ
jgi:hypothetical protein